MPTRGLQHVTQLEDCFPSEVCLTLVGLGKSVKQESLRPGVITHHPDSCRASQSEWCPCGGGVLCGGMEPPAWCCMESRARHLDCILNHSVQLAALITQGRMAALQDPRGSEPSSACPSGRASCQEPPAETWLLSAHHSPVGRPDEEKPAWCPHQPSVNLDQPALQEGRPSEQILLLVIISAFSLTRLSTLLQHCGRL